MRVPLVLWVTLIEFLATKRARSKLPFPPFTQTETISCFLEAMLLLDDTQRAPRRSYCGVFQ